MPTKAKASFGFYCTAWDRALGLVDGVDFAVIVIVDNHGGSAEGESC